MNNPALPHGIGSMGPVAAPLNVREKAREKFGLGKSRVTH
jgi:hypothetical protein